MNGVRVIAIEEICDRIERVAHDRRRHSGIERAAEV
jgi:hypothetical protein